jgi:hypothetical protein
MLTTVIGITPHEYPKHRHVLIYNTDDNHVPIYVMKVALRGTALTMTSALGNTVSPPAVAAWHCSSAVATRAPSGCDLPVHSPSHFGLQLNRAI